MLSDEEKKKFYGSQKWRNKAKSIQRRDKGVCNICKKLILGRHVVDHIIELTPQNVTDENIAYGEENLQLLCLSCHTIKTFKTPNFMDSGVIDFSKREELLKNCKGKAKNQRRPTK